jgi:hypothetical protein
MSQVLETVRNCKKRRRVNTNLEDSLLKRKDTHKWKNLPWRCFIKWKTKEVELWGKKPQDCNVSKAKRPKLKSPRQGRVRKEKKPKVERPSDKKKLENMEIIKKAKFENEKTDCMEKNNIT